MAGHRRRQGRDRHRRRARHRARHRDADGEGRRERRGGRHRRGARRLGHRYRAGAGVGQRIKQAGGKAIASTLSITEPQNAEAIVKAAIDAFGRVDILVNNAGILRDRIFHRMSWSDWHDVINVHLNGSFNMARAVAGHFREQDGGAMVHMTSTSGLIGNFGQANYMAAKLGIHGPVARHRARHGALQCALELHLALRLEPHDRLDPDRDRAEKQRVERLKQMTPDKIAPLAVYLCSDKADGISGQIIGVRNNEIFLFTQPRPIRVLHRSDGWTPRSSTRSSRTPSSSRSRRSSAPATCLTWDPVLMAIVYDNCWR